MACLVIGANSPRVMRPTTSRWALLALEYFQNAAEVREALDLGAVFR